MRLKKILLIVVLLSILISQNCTKVDSNEATEKFPVKGVYEYMFEKSEGMAIYGEKYFIHFAVPKADSSLSSPLTDSNKSAIFSKMLAIAGTYTVADTMVTCKILYAKSPSQVGSSFRYAFSKEGDFITWRVYNEENKVIQKGRSRILE